MKMFNEFAYRLIQSIMGLLEEGLLHLVPLLLDFSSLDCSNWKWFNTESITPFDDTIFGIYPSNYSVGSLDSKNRTRYLKATISASLSRMICLSCSTSLMLLRNMFIRPDADYECYRYGHESVCTESPIERIDSITVRLILSTIF
jgi:hypothetical protein